MASADEEYDPLNADSDDEENDLNDGEDEVGGGSSSSSASAAAPSGPIQVFEIVEVLGGDRPYAGVVTGMVDEANCRVKYFEFEAEVCLPLSSVTRLVATGPTAVSSPDGIQLNSKGIYQCKYATDQQYYDAMVTAATAHGCNVTYSAYGNAEEVPLAYLRKIHQGSAPHAKKAGQDKSMMPLNIPDSLKILPTDTEEVHTVH